MTKEETILFKHGFKHLTLNEKDMFNKYFLMVGKPLSSCASFASVIGWSNDAIPYYKEVGSSLCLIFEDKPFNAWVCFAPYTDYSLAAPVEAMLEYERVFSDLGKPFEMSYVKEWMLPVFDGLEEFDCTRKHDEKLSDYIYTSAAFSDYLSKPETRYNIRYAKRKFNITAETLTEENRREISDFFKEIWCPYHSCESCVYGCMHKALENMLNDSGLEFILLRSDKEPAAYAGFEVCGGELMFLVKKVNRSMKGMSDLIHEAVFESVKDRISAVNYTEDMGNENLRRYKQKLAPYTLSHNYELCFRRKNR